MEMSLCYPKEVLRKVPGANLKNSLGSVGVAVKVDINKPLVESSSATFAGILTTKSDNVSSETLF